MIDYVEQQARREAIVRWLQQRSSLSVAELTARLAVSRMTIHRDLHFLMREGVVTKRHGWVEWVDRAPRDERRGEPGEHTRWEVILPSGQRQSACCPSCGLRRATTVGDDTRIDVADTLHGHRIDGRRATYVIGSRINLCCWPSALAFEDAVDAYSFQRGFGGQVATFADACAAMSAEPPSQVPRRAADPVGSRRPAQRLAQAR